MDTNEKTACAEPRPYGQTEALSSLLNPPAPSLPALSPQVASQPSSQPQGEPPSEPPPEATLAEPPGEPQGGLSEEPEPHLTTQEFLESRTAEDFHPAVQTISRIKAAGRTYAKKTKIKESVNDLMGIMGDLMSAVKDDDKMATSLRAINRLTAVGCSFAKRTEIEADLAELVNISGQLMAELKESDPMEANLRKQSAQVDAAFTALLMKATRDDKFDENTFDIALKTQRQYRMNCQTVFQFKKAREQTDMKELKDYEASKPYRRPSDPFKRT